jgi:hypothetical protein
MLYIPPRRALIGGHYPNSLWEPWQRPLAAFIEQTLGLELAAEPLELQIGKPDAKGNCLVHIKLVDPLSRIDIEPAVN